MSTAAVRASCTFTVFVACVVLLLTGSSNGAVASASQGLVAFERLTCTYEDEGETCSMDIWVVNGDGGGERLLTRKPTGGGGFPAWSPDGRRIAFVSESDREVWVMNRDGSGQRRLTRLSGDVSSFNDADDPAWAPDGRRIAFGSGRHLYTVSADGTSPRRLTEMPADADSPSWAPDGRRIAFHTHAFGRDAIYVINADGANRRRLTPKGLFAGGPAWSPDGRRILFWRRKGDLVSHVLSVNVINANGTGLRQLSEAGQGGHAAWSPDGRRIAFARGARLGVDFTVSVMSTDGGGETRVSQIGTVADQPAWSPDGRRIAFRAHLSEGRAGGIYVVNDDGTGQRKLTRIECDGALPPDVSHSCYRPVWQPRP